MKLEQFLEGVSDWSNHRILLWYALEQTTGDVVEMGCGDGSTPHLHQYCKERKRMLYSFETDKEYLKKFKHLKSKTHKFIHVENDWHKAKDLVPNPSVILIDHAPGERRIVDIKRYCDSGAILVCHDTQPPPTAADYGYERIWNLFKYRVTLSCPVNPEPAPDGTLHNRTWATAISNTHELNWGGFPAMNDYTIGK